MVLQEFAGRSFSLLLQKGIGACRVVKGKKRFKLSALHAHKKHGSGINHINSHRAVNHSVQYQEGGNSSLILVILISLLWCDSTFNNKCKKKRETDDR